MDIHHGTNLLHLNSKADSGHFRAVIEIPAGTNKKTEIDHQSGEFKISLRNGQPRNIDFLGYPINYGFVPGTLMDKARGGDGDPIDALIICESVAMKTVIEFIPIAVLRLKDSNELDSKIIAVPANLELRTICATNFIELKTLYPAIMEILVVWFKNYDKANDTTEFIAWEDEVAAKLEIEKWVLG
jgi:inorganic pyrophosphatase